MDFAVGLLRGLLGLSVILGIALLLSENRRAINWRTVVTGLGLQIVLAILILKGRAMGEVFAPLGWPAAFFSWVSSFFVLVLNFTTAGAEFVFGPLGRGDGGFGVIFATQILPTIIFFSALMSILYYLGVMQKVVQGMAAVVRRALGTSGAESLSVTANIFVGQTEAPLVVRPYLERMTHSELMAVMTGGMATIAGGVMAAYIQILGGSFAEAQGVPLDAARLQFAEQLLGASLMAAPAALLLAKILVPETAQPTPAKLPAVPAADEGTAVPYDSETAEHEAAALEIETGPKNVIDAAAAGAVDGVKLALNVGGMLIAFIALIAMGNHIIGWAAGLFGAELTLEQLLGWGISPLAWLIGVPWADAVQFGSLLGTKVVLNEFVAYLSLGGAIEAGALSPKAIVMATFALCGFANFSSIAIQIGGIGPLAPSRTSELAQLGLRAVLAGTLANMMTATIAGVLVG